MPVSWNIDMSIANPVPVVPDSRFVSTEYDEDMAQIEAAIGRVVDYFNGRHFDNARAGRFKEAVQRQPGEDITAYRDRAVQAIDAIVRMISPCTDYLTSVLAGGHGVIAADRGIGIQLYHLYADRAWNDRTHGLTEADRTYYKKLYEDWDKRMLWETLPLQNVR